MLTDKARQLAGCIVQGGVYSAEDALGCYIGAAKKEDYILPEDEVAKLTTAINQLPGESNLTDSEIYERRIAALLRMGDLAINADDLDVINRETLLDIAVTNVNEYVHANPGYPSVIEISESTKRWRQKATLKGYEWIAKILGVDESADNEVVESCSDPNLGSYTTTYIGYDGQRMIGRPRKEKQATRTRSISSVAVVGLFAFWVGSRSVNNNRHVH